MAVTELRCIGERHQWRDLTEDPVKRIVADFFAKTVRNHGFVGLWVHVIWTRAVC